MDLRRLRLFLAVVAEGGFTATSRAVHVAQLSAAVRDLEVEFRFMAGRHVPASS